MIGISGAHRVGKSTLAKAYAESAKIDYVPTTAVGVFKRLGLDPAAPMDFGTRLMVQREILKEFDGIYAQYAGKVAVTDRTPLDLMAYTLAECVGDAVSEEEQVKLATYMQDCFDVFNKRFFLLMIIQPGIELVAEEGKAALNKAYIEHLNAIILGLSVDERLRVPHFYLPRRMLDLDDRIIALKNSNIRVRRRAEQDYIEAVEDGRIVRH